jgi:hypothetical protein
MEKTPEMPAQGTQAGQAPPGEQSHFVTNSNLYKEFLAEREEILKHKWIESEKAGSDIGFEKALLDWIVKHRSNWRNKRMKEVRSQAQIS